MRRARLRIVRPGTPSSDGNTLLPDPSIVAGVRSNWASTPAAASASAVLARYSHCAVPPALSVVNGFRETFASTAASSATGLLCRPERLLRGADARIDQILGHETLRRDRLQPIDQMLKSACVWPDRIIDPRSKAHI